MQMRAILEAAARAGQEGIKVHPKIMIPLVGHVNELQRSAPTARGRGQGDYG